MKCRFIEQQKHEYPIIVMCRVLGISESGFFAWRKRPAIQRQREDAQLKEEIEQVFVMHQGRYGSPRIHRELHDQGRGCSRKRIARLMREAGWYAKRKRHRILTTRRDATHPVVQSALRTRFYSNRTQYQMGDGYHVHFNNPGMAVFGGDPGRVFAGGRRMVDVKLLR